MPSAAIGQSLDQTCVLVLTKVDPATVNVAYPDDSAQYYSAGYQLVPGTRIRIDGRFPHARYMSFNVYDPAQRPLDATSDIDILPDPGASNPFRVGADRAVDRRSYTVFIETGPAPEHRAPNTLYTGTGQDGAPNVNGSLIYRIYVPDVDRDDTGGVGLPTVTIEPEGSTAAPAASPCSVIEKPAVDGVNEMLARQAIPVTAPTTSGSTNPPTWRKFVNVLSALGTSVAGTPRSAGVDLDTVGGSGGFLSNRDNAYVSTQITRYLGQVVSVRFRAPTFADTRSGAPTTPGGDLRYWSLCENDPPSQRMVACLNDDQFVIAADGFVTVVISTPGQRPATASAACGLNWLPWGPNQRGVLIYRHMLPDPTFAEAIQRADADHEAATMGDFLPVGAYYADAAAFDRAVDCTP